MTTPEQQRRNRKTGIILLVFVAAVFAWTVFRGAVLLAGKLG
ncbi:cytochrome oxidase small assembly protein [Bordetella genomosp. 13]|nr:cytochrome oxidase small assembly protein [Bordetella genomosp. 13]